MAAILELLRYSNFVAEDDATCSTEGKFGIPRFGGEPTRLAEYMFRVKARTFKGKAMSKEEREKLGPLGLRLVEGLSGTAVRLAQTLSFEDLAKEDGADRLLAALEAQLKPKRLQQARELYAAGAAVHGVLSRQGGEPMASYVLRRRTWYRCLLDCSAEMALPDMVLAEQLLASAAISHDHQLLVRTALKGEITFDAVAEELIAQHGKIHEREKRTIPRVAMLAARLEESHGRASDNYLDNEDEGQDDGEVDAYFAEEEPDILDEQIGFLMEDGVDLDDPDAAEYAADVMQAEQEAYFAKKGAAGKGKGFRQPPARQFQVTGSLSLEERRAKVAALKARTTCRRCGARGHWSGDPTCPHTKGGKKGKGPSSPSPPMTSTTTSLRSVFGGTFKGSSKPRTVYFSIREHPDLRGTANMAVRHGGGDRPGREYRAVPPPSSLDAPAVVDDDEPASPTPSTTWCVVTAERRSQWTDLPGQYALEPRQTAGALVQQARPCTGEEIEDALLREAL